MKEYGVEGIRSADDKECMAEIESVSKETWKMRVRIEMTERTLNDVSKDVGVIENDETENLCIFSELFVIQLALPPFVLMVTQKKREKAAVHPP